MYLLINVPTKHSAYVPSMSLNGKYNYYPHNNLVWLQHKKKNNEYEPMRMTIIQI